MIAASVGLLAAYAKGRMDESKRRDDDAEHQRQQAMLNAFGRLHGLDRIGK
jgi:hypothetical protein